MYVDKELARKLHEKHNRERRKSGLPEEEMAEDYVPEEVEEKQKELKKQKKQQRRDDGLPSESEEEPESDEERAPTRRQVQGQNQNISQVHFFNFCHNIADCWCHD